MGEPQARERWANWLVVAGFAALAAFSAAHHEPWVDEAQAWMIARDVPSSDFFVVTAYEGSPGLWHLALAPLARSGLGMRSMAVLNWAILVALVAVFVHRAPFAWWHRVLFAFGYFVVYEYGTIARSYGLGALLLVLAAATHARRFDHPRRHGLVIALLANTSTHGAAVAIAWMVSLAFDTYRKGRVQRRLPMALALAILGIVIAIAQVIPPADVAPRYAGLDLDLTLVHFARLPNAVVSAFVPVPVPVVQFWETKLAYVGGAGFIALGIPIFVASLVPFLRRPRPLFLHVCSCAGLFAIFFLKHRGFMRHYGLVFLAFMAALWVARTEPAQSAGRAFGKAWRTVGSALLTSVLTLHVVGAGIAVSFEWQAPFSSALSCARYLNELGTRPALVSHGSSAGQGVLPFLEWNAPFVSLENGSVGTYTVFNASREAGEKLPDVEVARRALIALAGHEEGYLLSTVPRDEPVFLESFELVERFGPAIVRRDGIWLYRPRRE